MKKILLVVVVLAMVLTMATQGITQEKPIVQQEKVYEIKPYPDGEWIPNKDLMPVYRQIIEDWKIVPAEMGLEITIQSSADKRGKGSDNNELSSKRGVWAKDFLKENLAHVVKNELTPLGYLNDEKSVQVKVKMVVLQKTSVEAAPAGISKRSIFLAIAMVAFVAFIFIGPTVKSMYRRRKQAQLAPAPEKNKSKTGEPNLKKATVHVDVDDVDTIFFLHGIQIVGKDAFIYPIRPNLNCANGIIWTKLISNLRNDLKNHFKKANDSAYMASEVGKIISNMLINKIIEREGDESPRRIS
jgi:hypothetical protein